ncbi:SDR family NAD(P)-dependent oxidoreductase [Streptomyces sp. CoH27]|uniref:SDR family NAD(P)-dependent oxidoreductase n=1 Tax=Streptomyces sp. CoH27 TaxID=2875763 RepID=UPI0027DFC587|nr:SDR family NAD(P)-dependent oxidoreductase [Streptomyces sp. CoH27]
MASHDGTEGTDGVGGTDATEATDATDAADAADADIAIVGMAGRFPGAGSVEEFWDLLREGREGLTRFTPQDLAPGIPAALSTDPAYVPAHGVLPDVDLFDTAFFELTPAEAEVTDPQHRLFLETCHAALENAGWDPSRYDGLISVYGGAAINTYLQQNVLPAIDQTATSDHFRVMVGNDKDFLATRVSYKLGLRGPSYSVQTACSTSLVAIHLACQGLINGECDMALAGGVTVKLPQRRGYLYEEGAILSPDGRVRTFDADAGGTVLGNGVGVVVLKPLADALADGDTVYAVIKATATNNDGSAKVSYSAPSKEGQAAVIAEAHAVAGVDPRTITYVEAHGTATRLGDPVEVSALTDAFRRAGDDTGFCAIGSLKSNVGHLDAAAGVAGVIKTALMLRHRSLVPSLNFERPNPAIDFAASPFYVSTDTRPWECEGPRRAGVSSFGIGGTNAHAVLEEAPEPTAADPSPRDAELLVLSARTPTALDTLTDRLADHLAAHPGAPLADVAHTLAVGRRPHRYRRTVICRDTAEAVRLLRERTEPGCRTGEAGPRSAGTRHIPDRSLPGDRLLETVRDAWLGGADIDWAVFYEGERRRRVPLPTYPFEGRRVWLEPPAPAPAPSGGHPLLGANTSTLAEHRYDTALTGTEFYLAEHRVGGEPVMPAVAYLEMARAAGALSLPPGPLRLSRVSFEAPLSFAAGPRTVRLLLTPHGDGARFTVTARPADAQPAAGEEEIHARGELTPAPGDRPANLDADALLRRCPDTLAGPELYDLLRAHGLDYGPSMRAVRELRRGTGEAVGELVLPDTPAARAAHGPEAGFALHPALLDGALHTVVGLLAAREEPGTRFLPLALGALEVGAPLPQRCLAHVELPAQRTGTKQVKADVTVTDPDGVVVARLRELSVRTVRDEHRPPATALFRAAWTAADETAAADRTGVDEPAPGGPLLLLAHEPERRAEMVAALRAVGAGDPDVILVTPGTAFTRVDDGHYTVGPAAQADYTALLDGLGDGRRPTAVLHTWCHTDAPADPLAATAADQGPRSVVALTKALLERRGTAPTGVLIAHRTDDAGADPAPAALAGFGRGVTQENPRLTFTLVGLDAGTPAGPALAAELARTAEGEREVRHRGGVRLVRRHRRAAAPAAETAPAFRDGAVYVITGGTGPLGLAVAQHIAAGTRARLELLARGEPGADALRTIERIRAAGSTVTVRRADVTDPDALGEALAAVRAEHGPVRGVVHAAGLLGDSFLLRKSWAEFAEVIRPKTDGTVHLDRLTADDPLDFFVCFSSIAGVFGNAGQSDYGYANAFLDAFAERRAELVTAGHRRGLSLSLAWPLWQDGGMRQSEEAARALAHRLGLAALPTADALAALTDALAGPAGAVLVGHGDLARISAALEPVPARPRTAEDTPPQPSVPPREESGVRPSAPVPAEWATSWLRRLLARETKLDPAELDPEVPFDRYGIDSLVITRLNTELERHFEDLPKTLFFEYTTLEELAGHFITEYGPRLAELAAAEAAPQPPAEARAPHHPETPHHPQTQRTLETPKAFGSPQSQGNPGDADGLADGIAVIGLAGRYPLADDLDEFWENLAAGRDCVTEIPADRWDHDRYFHPDPSATGRAFGKWGGFVRDVDRFDPLFFGIAPREAELMDPQERLFLQNAWHVVEDAGYRRADLSGRRVGVFVGVMYGEYQLYGAADAERGGIRVTGSSFASIANRVSYTLGLTGPSIALDTMCSSSLTAIHLACDSLARGESELALAGGVNLSLHPYKYVFLSQGRFLSTDGRCRAFGADGSGYVPGEGVGAVLLKPLSAAIRDGDHIHGVIRGHAVNHGGRTNGYTVPSPKAQADTIERALRAAGLAPSDIDYLEAHGTGTALGDPIEIAGLTKVFGSAGPDREQRPIGSVKSAVGHLESAAGIAGLTKVLLQFRHDRLVPSLHADEPNPNIDFSRSPFRVQRTAADWPRHEGTDGPAPRRAGLSSFGAGGANAHLVVEEHLDRPQRTDVPVAEQRFRGPLVFPLSARDPERLRAYAARLADFAERARVRAADLAHTLQTGREAMEERLVIVAENGAQLLRALREGAVARRDGEPALVRRDGDAASVRRDGDAELVGPYGAGVSGRRGGDAGPVVERLVAQWLREGKADWSLLPDGGEGRPRRIPAPLYPFARERYWVPAADRTDPTARRPHPLIDANESTLDEVRFRRTFRADEPLIRDHLIEGRLLLAGTVCLELARAAARLAGLGRPDAVRDVLWGRPVELAGDSRDVYVTLSRATGDRGTAGELSFTVWTHDDGDDRTVHVRGTVSAVPEDGPAGAPGDGAPGAPADLTALRAAWPERVDRAAVQRAYHDAGFAYGPSFEVIDAVHRGTGGALVRLTLPGPGPATGTAEAELLSPALLDGALRACHWADAEPPGRGGQLAVPFSLDALRIAAPGRPLPRSCWAYAVPTGGTGTASQPRRFDVRIVDDHGHELLSLTGFGGRLLPTAGAETTAAPATGSSVPPADPFFYRQEWADRAPEPARSAAADTVLVLDGTGTTAAALAAAAPARRIVEVRPGTEFERTAPDRFTVVPERTEDYERILRELNPDGVRALDVVHLWGLHSEPARYGTDAADDTARAALDRALALGVGSLRALVRAVGALRPAARVRCAYVVEEAEESAGGVRPDQEAAAGFAASVTAVVPGCELFTVTCADGLARSPGLAELLTQELDRGGRTAGLEVRRSRSGRQVRVLRRVTGAGEAGTAPEGLPLKTGGTYLVTGGTGGIGLTLARHLAAAHRARLVLVSRSADRPEARAAAEELTTLGATVLLAAADAADAEGMRAVLDRAKERFGHLDGVFHLAGAADRGTVLTLEPGRFAELLAAKAHGVRLLDALTADEPLDLFVVFSSLASVVGDFGACAYAAANRFLDSYAELRAARVRAGLARGRTLALAWPLWQAGGVDELLSETELAGFRRRTGMRAFTGDEGILALERAAGTGLVRVAPALGDPATVDQALTGHPDLPGPDPELPGPDPAEPERTGAAAAELASGTLTRLGDHLRDLLARVLGLAAHRIDPRTPLEAYGLESVLVMEVNQLLERDFPGVRGTVLFEYRTVQELAGHLLSDHAEDVRRLFPTPGTPQGHTAPRPAHEHPTPVPDKTEAKAEGKAKAKAEGKAEGKADDIAIIGISGRYPDARDLDEFWENLLQGRDSVTEVPRERWDADAVFHADASVPGTSYGRWGGFLDDVDRFDSLFFRIPPAQAKLMDPQERLFLEASWSALENAGYPPSRLPRPRHGGQGHDVGVFAGVMWGDYAQLAAEESVRGNHHAVLANRSSVANQVSYFCDFRGPSVVVDTACSSSLVALHQACESLRRGECRYALAGGVNVSVHPLKYQHLSRMRMLSTDGRCRSFGAGGSGYVPGEGVGVVLLKRLSEAVADGDHIHAVIKATAVNHGGRTSGYTVPNPQAQQALIEEALERAGIDPATVGCVEAHGTGTALGDPIEHTALRQAFADAPDTVGVRALGSVKSNIGHLEGAAGIAGVTKAVLQLAHGRLVPSLHADELNPVIDFSRSAFRVQREAADWPRPTARTDAGPVELPRRASVSSFGAGGTNAHVILEEYRAPAEATRAAPSDSEELLVLSARTAERLRVYAGDLATYLHRARPRLADVGHTLRAGREPLPERLAFLASGTADAVEKLAAFARGETGSWAVLGTAEQHASIADVFTEGAGPGFLRTLAADGDHTRLARLWVSGAFDTWHPLNLSPGPHHTVPLPSYPFEHVRHWLPLPDRAGTSDTTRTPAPGTAAPGPAPAADLSAGASAAVSAGAPALVSAGPPTAAAAAESPEGRQEGPRHESAAGPAERRSLWLAGEEPVVRDHVVGGRRVLPGVGHLDLVAAALDGRTAYVFQEVRWLSPVVVEGDGTRLALDLRPGAEDGRQGCTYRLHAADGERTYSTGRVLPAAPAPCAPLEAERIRAASPREVSGADLYAGLGRQGLPYGPYFQRVERAWTGAGGALARLLPPRACPDGAGHANLRPGMLDAALHPLSVLLPETDGERRPLLPFAADTVEVHGPVPATGWSYVRDLGGHRYDVTLADDTGQVRVRILGLALRELRRDGHTAAAHAPGTDFRPRWISAPRPAPDPDEAAPRAVLTVAPPEAAALADALEREHPHAEHTRLTIGADGLDEGDVRTALDRAAHTDLVYFLAVGGEAGLPATATRMDADRDRTVVSLHRLLRGLEQAGFLDRPLRLKAVTGDGFPLGDHDPVRPWAAGPAGLCEVAAKEFPRLRTACLDVRGTEAVQRAADIAAEPTASRARPVSLRGGVRRVRVLEGVELPEAPTRFRDQGVYLVIGGLGVLGRDTARYLARTHRARLVLVGRSPLDDERRAELAAIGELGGQVRYVACDAADPVALRRAVDTAKDVFGALHGVIHSAMVLADEPIRTLPERRLRSALTAKADTLWSTFQAVHGEPLDFVLLYSSAVTLEGNHGQAGYAAGCHVADACALAAARTVPYPVRIVHWGYWHGGGDAHRDRVLGRLAAAGIEPIRAAEGMAAVERVLSGTAAQTLVLKAAPGILEGLGADPHTVLRPQPVRPAVALGSPGAGPADGTDGPAAPSVPAATERLARRLLVGALRRMGVLHAPGERYTHDGLRSRLGIAEGRERLLGLLVDVLLRGGWLRTEADGTLVTTDALHEDPELRRCLADPEAATRELTDRHPEALPVATLLLRCVEALPEVLTGRRGHLDVLFPGGSLDLVEAVYQSDPVADRCNDQVADTVLAYVQERRRRDPAAHVRILEVGAGTGGTSERVLRQLSDAGLGDHLTYVCTDVSEGFVRHGRRRFAEAHPYAEFRVLDIERDPVAQDFAPGGCDLVLASNVLHATRRIHRTLAHVKRLLGTHGVLVVNEGVELQDQMSLVFGLTDGWWLFEDAEHRLPGSPLLSLGGWYDVLAELGFGRVTAHRPPGGDGGPAHQRVLVAHSDGLVPSAPAAAPPSGPAGPAVLAEPERPMAAAIGRPAPAAPVERTVRSVFAQVLEMPEHLLDPRATFDNYGVDSLVALTLTKELEPHFGPLPATLLFEHITIERLAAFLAPRATTATATTTTTTTTTTADAPPPARQETASDGLEALVQGLSDEDVDRLLRELSTALRTDEEQR